MAKAITKHSTYISSPGLHHSMANAKCKMHIKNSHEKKTKLKLKQNTQPTTPLLACIIPEATIQEQFKNNNEKKTNQSNNKTFHGQCTIQEQQ